MTVLSVNVKFVVIFKSIGIMNDMLIKMMARNYVSPAVEVQELYPEGVLCSSGTEDIEYLEGEW